MATSAIYTFVKNHANPQVDYYIHYDGYPEGAASYFVDMLSCENRRGGLHTAFMRANDLAEFASEGLVGEYHYVVDGDKIECFNVQRGHHLFFSGDILDFVSKFANVKMVRVRGKYMTKEQVFKEIDSLIAQVNHQDSNGWTGNASSSVNELWAVAKEYRNAFGEDDTYSVVVEFIEKMDKKHCVAYRWATQMNKTEDEAYAQWVDTFRK